MKVYVGLAFWLLAAGLIITSSFVWLLNPALTEMQLFLEYWYLGAGAILSFLIGMVLIHD